MKQVTFFVFLLFVVLRNCNWVLHHCSDNVTLRALKDDLVSNASGNSFFPAIEPFYRQCRQAVVRTGMSMGDLVGVPLDFQLHTHLCYTLSVLNPVLVVYF